ncbi:cytidine deaminase [Comamonas terrigena]|uniref:cytidine deaminase n=1 Tax=Comamonas terrigena TaxID=32013 RepID=UPI0028998509|nr:cytidine deaminase [Comamonas terrigena]
MKKNYTNIELMAKAIEEQNKCNAYPKVGVVIAKDGEILATGFRGEVPKLHAERVAIGKLEANQLEGVTIVTTLEPCVEFHSEQPERPCAELITQHAVREVIIGVLDPNGKVYSQGYNALLNANIQVSFFEPHLRMQVEGSTFKDGDVGRGYGPEGTRRVGVVGTAGKRFTIQRSRTDLSSIDIRWRLIQYSSGVVDLHTEHDNYAVREACGARDFNDISDPLVFRETAHAARMKVGDIAVIYPKNSTFAVLIKLKELTEYDLTFKWQVREISEVKAHS